MGFLLKQDEILTSFVTNLFPVITHALRHLLHLRVVIVHRLLTAVISVLYFRQAPLEDGLCLLHLFGSLRSLFRNAHTFLFLHSMQFFVERTRLAHRGGQ